VRVEAWSAQALRKGVHILTRKLVFHQVCPAVPVLGGHACLVREIGFVKSMGAQEVARLFAACCRKVDLVTGRLGKARAGEFCDDFSSSLEGQPQRSRQARRGGGGLGIFRLMEMLQRIPGLGMARIGRACLSESIRHIAPAKVSARPRLVKIEESFSWR
jgi:hypothetical protein